MKFAIVLLAAVLAVADAALYNAAMLNGKKAYQTSTAKGGLASRAVDGNMKSCSQTGKPGTSQFWVVKLGRYVRVAYVTIYNKMDANQERIDGVTVYAGNTGERKRRKCGVIKYVKNQQKYVVKCKNAKANQIKIFSGKSYLTLCEVEVMSQNIFTLG